MNYTIATTRDYNGMQYVNLDKLGNKYLVGFTGKAEGEYTHKMFDTLAGALAVYQQFVRAFITGDYSYEGRKSLSWREDDAVCGAGCVAQRERSKEKEAKIREPKESKEKDIFGNLRKTSRLVTD